MAAFSATIIYPGHFMRALTLLLLSSLLLTACAAVDDSKKNITLDKALWQYETAIRWVDFSSANSLRRPEGATTYSPCLLYTSPSPRDLVGNLVCRLRLE